MTKEREHMINDHREKLMDYIYHELPPDEVQAFEVHLKGCPVCQRDLADFRQVSEALASWDLEGVPHISLTVDPQPRRRWLDLFRTLPFGLRLVSAAAMAMLLLAIFNVRLSYNAHDGFQFSASLLPQRPSTPSAETQPRPPGFTEEQVRAMIEKAIYQADQERHQKVAAQLDALARNLRSQNQQTLIKLAQSLREEQDERLLELSGQAQNSYTTLADLLGGGTNNGY